MFNDEVCEYRGMAESLDPNVALKMAVTQMYLHSRQLDKPFALFKSNKATTLYLYLSPLVAFVMKYSVNSAMQLQSRIRISFGISLSFLYLVKWSLHFFIFNVEPQ